jgi:phosphohistidine swiveling domain-containing protein
MRSGTAHFRITGAGFTRLVHDRMLDDAPDAAYRLATSIGSGNPAIDDTIPKIAQRLCDGVVSLRGDETGMDVVEHDHKGYRRRLAWLHAGRIRMRDRWWQPVAYVADVGPMDLRNDHGVRTYTPAGGRGIINRGWHYCGKDEIVVDHAEYSDRRNLDMRCDVIFRACVERPHWHQPVRSPQAALEEYLAAGRRLERRGHSVSYGKDPERWPSGYAGRAWAREPEPPAGGPARYHGTVPNEAMQRKLEEEAEASRLRRVADLRKLVLDQAGDDLIELAWEARGEVPAGKAMIPRAPFLLWAFSRLRWYQRFMPEWRTVCPGGMKMAMDDPNHTDWVVGGGFDPQDRDLYWGGAKAEAADRLRAELQDAFETRQRAEDEAVVTLITGPVARGPVVHGVPGATPEPGRIVVVPNLHTRYLWAVQGAAAVITEEGGEVAHLAQVAREQALPVVRAEGALSRWFEGDVVEVDPEARTVRVISRALEDPADPR